jgi:2',3'-cyclic-nucleotide 2'-phosphodiesterase (5'-nucleotidase family)
VAISSGNDNVFYAAMPENTVLLQTGSQGRTLGLLKIGLDEKGVLRVNENRYLSLLSSVPDDAKIAGLVEEFKKTQQQKAAELARKQHEKTYQGLMEGLQLSPQEFMERYGKEQTEKGKGEPR